MRGNQRNLIFPLGWDPRVNREWRPAIKTAYPQSLERVYGDPDSGPRQPGPCILIGTRDRGTLQQ